MPHSGLQALISVLNPPWLYRMRQYQSGHLQSHKETAAYMFRMLAVNKNMHACMFDSTYAAAGC
jgi:hypothetical protein